MAATERSQTDQVEDLQAAHPGWNVRDSGDAWKATRLGEPLTEAEHFAGLAETLIADSAEDLKALLVEQQRLTYEREPRRAAIWKLQQALGRELITAVAESEPALVVAGNRDEGTRTLTVRCDPRRSDGDRLWFWLDRSSSTQEHTPKPLIEADNLADAVAHIYGERKIRDQQAAAQPRGQSDVHEVDWSELS